MGKIRRYYSYPRVAEPLEFEMAPIARKFAYVAIFVSSFLIFGNLAANAYYNPQAVAEREFERMAHDYYENYYYDNFIAGLKKGYENNEQIEHSDVGSLLDTTEEQIASFDDYKTEAFYEYATHGFPRVFLRNLLLFDGGRNAKSRAIFSGKYNCNTNHTSIHIVPYAPFGKKDYTVEYEYDCEWINE